MPTTFLYPPPQEKWSGQEKFWLFLCCPICFSLTEPLSDVALWDIYEISPDCLHDYWSFILTMRKKLTRYSVRQCRIIKEISHGWIFCLLSHKTRSLIWFSITCSWFSIEIENRVENLDSQQNVNLLLNSTVPLRDSPKTDFLLFFYKLSMNS